MEKYDHLWDKLWCPSYFQKNASWNRQVHPGIPRPCVIFFKVRLVQRFFPWCRQVLHGFGVSTLAFKKIYKSPRKNHWATACCLKLSTPRYTSRSRRSIDKCCWTISGVLPWRCFINASLATKTCKQFSKTQFLSSWFLQSAGGLQVFSLDFPSKWQLKHASPAFWNH